MLVANDAMNLDYSAAGITVREDLRETHAFLLDHIRSPGTWWSGAERVAIAAESRNAAACALCRERKQALSPNAIQGEHDRATDLPAAVIEVAHRVRDDPARLSKDWFGRTIAAGLEVERYVEAIGVITLLAGADYFARSLGIAPFALPPPLPGAPSRHRPAGAKPGTAWVPMVAPEDASGPEQGLYGAAEFVPNIMRALSLVPDEARALQRSSDAHYVSVDKIGDPTVRRELDRPQMELVAARVSALNECFY